MVLTDRGLATGVISTPEIAQFALGDLAFWAHAIRGEDQDLSGSYRFVSIVDQPTSTILEVQAKVSQRHFPNRHERVTVML